MRTQQRTYLLPAGSATCSGNCTSPRARISASHNASLLVSKLVVPADRLLRRDMPGSSRPCDLTTTAVHRGNPPKGAQDALLTAGAFPLPPQGRYGPVRPPNCTLYRDLRPRPAALGLGVCGRAPWRQISRATAAARRRGRGYLRCSYHAATTVGGLTTGATILRASGRRGAAWAAHAGRFAAGTPSAGQLGTPGFPLQPGTRSGTTWALRAGRGEVDQAMHAGRKMNVPRYISRLGCATYL